MTPGRPLNTGRGFARFIPYENVGQTTVFFYTFFGARRAAQAGYADLLRGSRTIKLFRTRAEALKPTEIVEFRKTKLHVFVQSELETTNVRPCGPERKRLIGSVVVNARFSNFLALCVEKYQYR